jgi:hypothetical protein
MSKEHITAFMAATLFAIGAVVIIIMQHNSATAKIVGALSGSASASGSGVSAGLTLGTSASLAGTPTPGQSGYASNPTVIPVNIDPGYTFH